MRSCPQLQELVVVCREYLIGLSLETERRRLSEDPTTLKRQLELAACVHLRRLNRQRG